MLYKFIFIFYYTPALFEVEPSEIEQVNIEDISSFFGIVD